MAVSAVEICNRALDAIGQAAITSLSIPPDNQRVAICNRIYTDLRDELLQDHPWNFARRRASLAALAAAPEWGWDFQYEMPTDCLRVLLIDPTDPDVPWESEDRKILTNVEAPLYIAYVSNDVPESNFPPKFTTALVYRLAIDLCMPLTESASRTERLEKAFSAAIRSARGADAREHGPERLREETLINVRL